MLFSLSILVFEDDPILREILESQLLCHYPKMRLFTFGDVTETLRFIEESSKLDLAITDFLTGDSQDGYDIAVALRKRFHQIPILVISGSSPMDFSRLQQLLEMPKVHFLAKPYGVEQLLQKLRDCLSQN